MPCPPIDPSPPNAVVALLAVALPDSVISMSPDPGGLARYVAIERSDAASG